MEEELKILGRFVKSKALKEDIARIIKMPDNELKKILELHFKYDNDRSIIETILKDEYKGVKLHEIKNASFFFGILLQRGFMKECSIDDFINELKKLGFKQTTLKTLKPIFNENLKDILDTLVKPLINTYCDVEWRIVKIVSRKGKPSKENIKIEIKLMVHPEAVEHKILVFELTPPQFEKFAEEIDEIKKELKNVS